MLCGKPKLYSCVRVCVSIWWKFLVRPNAAFPQSNNNVFAYTIRRPFRPPHPTPVFVKLKSVSPFSRNPPFLSNSKYTHFPRQTNQCNITEQSILWKPIAHQEIWSHIVVLSTSPETTERTEPLPPQLLVSLGHIVCGEFSRHRAIAEHLITATILENNINTHTLTYQ